MFTLNRFNFKAAWPFLIPRAVGYSAGLINYFFRGKIDFACDFADVNQPCLIKNLGPEDLYGVFELWAENTAGNRSLVRQWGTNQCEVNGCTVVNGISVPTGGFTQVVGFTAPDNIARYVLVFRGHMGLEDDAVAAKVVPNSFLLMTAAATYTYHPSDLQTDTRWQQLGRGPLYRNPAEAEQRDFATGVAANDRLLFASFGGQSLDVDYDWIAPPVWKSTDGGRSFGDISAGFLPDVLNGVTYLGGALCAGGPNAQRHCARNDDCPQSVCSGGTELLGTLVPPHWNSVSFVYSPDLGATWQRRATLQTPPFAGAQYIGFPSLGALYIGNGVVLASGAPTSDGSGLVRSTDKGASSSEVLPFIDGARWTCLDRQPEELGYPDFAYPPPQCAEIYQLLYYYTHYHWHEQCDVPADCTAVDPVTLVPYWQNQSCSCETTDQCTFCSGYWIGYDFSFGDYTPGGIPQLHQEYFECWWLATTVDITPAPACFGYWNTDAMAWNNVEGDGSVVLIAGVAERVDSIGGGVLQYGIWKSTDGGQHWRWVLDTGAYGECPSSSAGPQRVNCGRTLADQQFPNYNSYSVVSVTIAPSGEALAIVEGWENSVPWGKTKKRLYRSIDAGETWVEITSPDAGSVGVMYLGGVPAGS